MVDYVLLVILVACSLVLLIPPIIMEARFHHTGYNFCSKCKHCDGAKIYPRCLLQQASCGSLNYKHNCKYFEPSFIQITREQEIKELNRMFRRK